MSNEFHGRINVGMKVRTSDGKQLGKVTMLSGETFEIEKGLFFLRDYLASFSEIARIEGDEIVLSVSEPGLEAMRASGGIGTSVHDRATGVVEHAKAALEDAVEAVHSSKKPDIKHSDR